MNIEAGEYKHFKGDLVEVLGVARHSEDHEAEFVVYTHNGQLWVRPVAMFLEHVERDGYSGPRFVKAS
jgi:hypothetical protein